MKNKETTLEEVAEKYSDNWELITGLDYENEYPSKINKLDFINGAKWQQQQFKNESTANYIDRHIVEALVETAKQERSYSEEEVYKIILNYQSNYPYASNEIGLKKWFEQFKKK